ncbi:MAG: Ig-like domain-containing protein, partial [Clostridia bacterium]|nr:Ig-like domain-containing protein [Clostridia bacterium]
MNKMKKFILGFFCVCIGLAGFAACGKSSSEKDAPMEQAAQADLTLEQESLSLIVGDRQPIYAHYNVLENTELSFVSADPQIASVNASGWVEAQKEGQTTVTVTYGEATATCQVSVGLGDLLPTIRFDQIVGNAAFVNVVDELNFAGSIVFNNKQYHDCTWSYDVVNDEIGSMENGLFKPKKAGETDVVVSASWRDVQSSSLQTVVRVSVSNLIELYVNGGMQSEIVLYTRSQFAGETYSTSETVLAEAYENGQKIAVETQLIAGSDSVAFDGSSVTALKCGEALLRLSCRDSAGVLCQKDIAVRVERPVYEWDEAVDFSALDGDLPLEKLFFGESVVLTEAYHDWQPLTVESNKLTDVYYGESKPLQSAVTLYTDEVGVAVTLNVYAKILRTAEDIRCLDISESVVQSSKRVLRGYYILANDIDATNLEPNTHAGLDSKTPDGTWYFDTNLAGFSGIFDGNGHTLDINVDSLGVFGVLLNGAHVRNIALNTYVTANTARGMSTSFILSNTLNRVTLNEVYISITDQRAENGAKIRYNTSLTNSIANTLQFTNVVVELKTDTWDAAYTGSVLGLGDSVGSTAGSYIDRFVNVYFIMPSEEVPIVKTSKYRIYGGNDVVESDEYLVYKYSNVKRYTSYAAMAADGENSYAGFSNDYWDKAGNAPIWKTESERHFIATADGAPTDELRLYTQESLGGKTFKTSAELGMQYVASSVQAAYTVLEGSDVIALDGNVVTAQKQGKAKIQISVPHGGATILKTVDVFVTLPALRYEKTIPYFSALDGELPLTEIFGEEVILRSAFDEKDNALTVQNNKVLGLKTSETGVTETTISVYSDEAGWIVPVQAYTKVIDSAADLTALEITQDKIDNGAAMIKGYYILTANIGSESQPYAGNGHAGLLQKQDGEWLYNLTVYGFAGILDGNGYSIYQNATRFGLFGTFLNGAHVKNVAIHTYAAAETLSSGLALVLAEDMRKTTVENCYFTLTDDRAEKSYNLILANGSGSPVLKNVVLDYKAGYNASKDGGALFNNEVMRTDDSSKDGVISVIQNRYTNVYVIAPAKTPIGKISSNKISYVYASNETQKETASDTKAVWTYAGKADGQGVTVVRYENTLALKNAGLDHSAFSASVWDTSYGIPVWKTLEKEYVATVDGVATEEVRLSSNGLGNSAQLGISLFGLPCADVTFEIVSGAETIELSNSGVVTAVAEGTATVVAKLGAIEKQFAVEVALPLEEYAETIAYFSAMDGVYINANGQETSLATIFGANVDIVKAETLDGTELTVTDNKLTGLQAAAATYTAMQEVTVVL